MFDRTSVRRTRQGLVKDFSSKRVGHQRMAPGHFPHRPGPTDAADLFDREAKGPAGRCAGVPPAHARSGNSGSRGAWGVSSRSSSTGTRNLALSRSRRSTPRPAGVRSHHTRPAHCGRSRCPTRSLRQRGHAGVRARSAGVESASSRPPGDGPDFDAPPLRGQTGCTCPLPGTGRPPPSTPSTNCTTATRNAACCAGVSRPKSAPLWAQEDPLFRDLNFEQIALGEARRRTYCPGSEDAGGSGEEFDLTARPR